MEPEPTIIATTAMEADTFSREERERHLYIVGRLGQKHRPTNLAMHDIMAGGDHVIDPW